MPSAVQRREPPQAYRHRGTARSRPVQITTSYNISNSDDSEEEQASWIADDICCRCGALAPHGKLYCSDSCRELDAFSSKLDKDTSPAATSSEEATIVAQSLDKLRYPMTRSPKLTTSSVPSRPSAFSLSRIVSEISLGAQHAGRSAEPDMSSSEEEADEEDAAAAMDAKSALRFAHLRNSSRSSASSSDPVETETTTPSPWQNGIDLDDSDLDRLDDPDMKLPPSVYATSHVLLRKGSSNSNATENRRSSASLSPKAPASMRTSPSPSIQFSRMPGATNLPAPVFYNVSAHLNGSKVPSGPTRPQHTVSMPSVPDRSAGDKGTGIFPMRKASTTHPHAECCALSHARSPSGATSPDRHAALRSTCGHTGCAGSAASHCTCWRQALSHRRLRSEPHMDAAPAKYGEQAPACAYCTQQRRSSEFRSPMPGASVADSRHLTNDSSEDELEQELRGRARFRTHHSCSSRVRSSPRASIDAFTFTTRR